MEKFSIQEGANAVRHCISYFARGQREEETIVQKAEYGLYVLEYISNYESIIRAAILLQKKDPVLAKIFQAFPNAEIIDIRDKKENLDGN